MAGQRRRECKAGFGIKIAGKQKLALFGRQRQAERIFALPQFKTKRSIAERSAYIKCVASLGAAARDQTREPPPHRKP